MVSLQMVSKGREPVRAPRPNGFRGAVWVFLPSEMVAGKTGQCSMESRRPGRVGHPPGRLRVQGRVPVTSSRYPWSRTLIPAMAFRAEMTPSEDVRMRDQNQLHMTGDRHLLLAVLGETIFLDIGIPEA